MDQRIIIGAGIGAVALAGAAAVAVPTVINKMKTKNSSGSTSTSDAATNVPTTGTGGGGTTTGGDAGTSTTVYVDVKASNSVAEAAKHVYGIVVANSKATDETVTIKKSLLTSKGEPLSLVIPAGKSYSLISDTEPFKVIYGDSVTAVKSNTETLTI